MPEIGFFVERIRPLERALTPTLALALRVVNAKPEPIHSMLVRCQVQIEPARRGYSPAERERLLEIFAAPERWGETLQPLTWQQVTTMVGGFRGTTVAEVLLPCSLDFTLASTKYFEALDPGAPPAHIPLRLLFSGTVFYQSPSDSVQAAPLGWDLEASYRMPAGLWRECMEAYYPGCVWLQLPRRSWESLRRFRTERGLTSWEAALEALLEQRARKEAA
ncbi:MAG TPA: DUF6084 family protein [Terriglobales bacterium]|nr:DUF6084 family protein [Terriglobales bacterium]